VHNPVHWYSHRIQGNIMDFVKSLAPVAKAGVKFGTFVAAAAAPVVVVLAAASWITKKD
jgi:hypothetical protein